MYIYYCWVTALLPTYQDGIVAGMARKGYMVGPAAKDGLVITPTHEGSPAVLYALGVYRGEETNVHKIYNDLVAVLKDVKAHYFSIIISLSTEATWIGTNVVLPVAEEKPPVPPASKKNMN